MTKSAAVKFYLTNLETGQRYPVVNEDLVIGRSGGDILVADDTKVSSQHCRIVVTPEGLAIHDLGSANGTSVDGQRLEERKLYPLVIDSVVRVGEQTFRVTGASRARPLKRKPKRKPKPEGPSSRLSVIAGGIGAVLMAMSLVLVITHGRRAPVAPPRLIPAAAKPAPLETPLDLVRKDLLAVIASYRELGHESDQGTDPKRVVQKIRDEVLPALRLVQAKLGAIKPEGEYEKRALGLDQKMSAAMLAQLSAISDNAEKSNPQAAQAIETYAAQILKLNNERKALEQQHAHGFR